MADGSELATLSNVSKAFGLSANTSAATGNELVTLSNVKALLENGGGGGGSGSSIDGYSWSELSQMSKEVQTLGVTAFREKYKDFLWKTKMIRPSSFGNIKDSMTGLTMTYLDQPVVLIGLAHDPVMNANYNAGFTFAFYTSYPMTYSDNGFSRGQGMQVDGKYTYRGSAVQKYCEALYYTMADADLKNCLVPVEKVNYPDANSFDYFFPISTTEFGFTIDEIAEVDDDPNMTYGVSGEAYEAFSTDYATIQEINKRRASLMVLIEAGYASDNMFTSDNGMMYRDFAVETKSWGDKYKRLYASRYAPYNANVIQNWDYVPHTDLGYMETLGRLICFNI